MKIDINEDIVDQVVILSLKESIELNREFPSEDFEEYDKALRTVYYYYSGKHFKE